MKPTPDQVKSLANMARQYPEFSEMLATWRATELEQLPYGKNETLDVLRGRVQALTEMQRHLGLRS